MAFYKLIKIIFIKELKLLLNNMTGILSVLSLSGIILFIFHYSLEIQNRLNVYEIIGLKWVILILTSYTLFSQSFWHERESGAKIINNLFHNRSLYFIIKICLLSGFLILVNFLLLLMFSFFFQEFSINLKILYANCLYSLPSIISFSILGLTLCEISSATRMKEVLLPVLFTPFATPILLFGMSYERKFIQKSILKLDNSFYVILLLMFLYFLIGLLLQESLDVDD